MAACVKSIVVATVVATMIFSEAENLKRRPGEINHRAMRGRGPTPLSLSRGGVHVQTNENEMIAVRTMRGFVSSRCGGSGIGVVSDLKSDTH